MSVTKAKRTYHTGKVSSTAKKPSVMARSKAYNKAIQEAYNYGYRDGYAAYEHIAKTRGAKAAAQYGYGRGLSAHKKVVKYQAKARR